ncbi:hypothetical protein [uncultured Treponema sp.]|uniref:hypothetical protein n=1 Tax=uncultured Treponema sp. TaxID=162155 RepID=UPI0025D238B9|nr:hypothetical protein [uncultured Treponema sp.]
MNSNGAIEKIYQSFERYYTVSTQNVEAPFVAEAVFKSHNEQYFLIKAAKVADIDSNDFVFFYSDEDSSGSLENGSLSIEKITELAQIAWKRGLSRISPYYGHRNTDVTLVILSEKIDEKSIRQIKKINYYKSYKFGFYGWSSFRLLVYETSTGRTVTNRRGSDLKKIVTQSLAKAS